MQNIIETKSNGVFGDLADWFKFLPPYSPNLNLIERLWKFMRKKVINDEYYEKFSEFNNAINSFIRNLHNMCDELKQFIGTKMHLLT